MKKILLFIAFIVSFYTGFGQSPGNDTTKYIWYRYQYGQKHFRLRADSVLMIPTDTTFSKDGIARKGTAIYVGNGTSWTAITGGDTTSLSDRIDDAYNEITSPNDTTLIFIKPNGLQDTVVINGGIDTTALASFGGGSGAAGDTTVFSTSAIYGSFYNSGSDTLVITSMQIGLQGTSPDITTEVFYNDSLNVSAGATKLVTAGNNVTGIYGLTTVSSFNNTKIPPGNWVWVKTSVVAVKPTYFTLTLIGYKKRR